ncbi:MATE family efflux transporter [Bacillus sp. SM2101]|uniref:MATE family efflux transporter n=1 Tax=Bacillus sp. SM2101 TaxID=2805366 RepID=UPI001BDF18E8|nr:MATE family efflux transporter [Bacillus sp. SM2101]
MNRTVNESILSNEVLTKNLVKRVIPIIAYSLVLFSFTLVDSLMISVLGEEYLGSVGQGGTFFTVVTILFTGILSMYTPMASRLNDSQLNLGKGISYFWMTSLLSIVFGLIVISILSFTKQFFYITGQTQEVTQIASDYINFLKWSSIPTLLFSCLINTANIYNISKIVVVTVLFGNIFNVILNWVLIYGIYVFPELGVNGVAISTLVSKIIMVIILFIGINIVLPKEKKLTNLKKITFDLPFLKVLLQKGFPKGLNWLNDWMTSFILLLMIGWGGAQVLASNEASSFLFSLLCMIPQAFCVSISVLISKFIGENKSKEYIKNNFKNIIKVMFASSLLISVIVLISFNTFFNLYNLSQDAKELATTIIYIKLTFFFFYNLQWSMTSLLDSFLDTKISSIISISVTYIFVIPMSYAAVKMGYGSVGVWVVDGIGILVISVLLYFRARTFLVEDLRQELKSIV